MESTCEPQQIEAKKTLDQVRTQAQPAHGASGLAYKHSRWEKVYVCAVLDDSSGKLEKWNDTYERNRFRFDNFDNIMSPLIQSGICRLRISHSGQGSRMDANWECSWIGWRL